MKTASEDVLHAIENLRNDPDFAVVKGWLMESYQERLQLTAGIEPEVMMRWSQGRCQCLSDIMETIETAPTVLKKLKG